MTRWITSPIYYINDYITTSLRAQLIIAGESNYTTDLIDQENFVVPFIIPAQQSSEANTIFNGIYSIQPYGVYTANLYLNHPGRKCGEISYIFYHNDIDKLIHIGQYLSDLLGRDDWSAIDVNFHFINDEDFPFDFKYISVDSLAGPGDTLDEGGRFNMILSIKFEYTYEGTGREEDIASLPGQGLGYS